MSSPVIEALDRDGFEADLDALADVLHACVKAGASVNFVMPYSRGDARAFWTGKVAGPLAEGTRAVLVARHDGRVVGTVQVDLDTPPNQAHRCEILKLLVHPGFRRRGIGRRLMAAAEEEARRRGRWLLTLDTRTGDSAEPLYSSLGYHVAGVIPDYARDPKVDRYDATTVMYKRLER